MTAPLNKGNYRTTKRRKNNVHSYTQKAWYEVPRIVINNDKPEVTIDIVETWFPEKWEKKNAKLKFIKKNEVTYKMSIPEAELIKYAAEHSFIKEEIKND